eukprot:1212142-Pleurochrysis_carterae.AAC.1
MRAAAVMKAGSVAFRKACCGGLSPPKAPAPPPLQTSDSSHIASVKASSIDHSGQITVFRRQ